MENLLELQVETICYSNISFTHSSLVSFLTLLDQPGTNFMQQKLWHSSFLMGELLISGVDQNISLKMLQEHMWDTNPNLVPISLVDTWP